MAVEMIHCLRSLPAGMFCSLSASALHNTFNWPNGAPAFVAVLAAVLLPSSVALWILADARAQGRRLFYDAGSFVFWPGRCSL